MRMQNKDRTRENDEDLAELFPNAINEAINGNGKVVRAIDRGLIDKVMRKHRTNIGGQLCQN